MCACVCVRAGASDRPGVNQQVNFSVFLSFTVKPKTPKVSPTSSVKTEGEVQVMWCVSGYALAVYKWYLNNVEIRGAVSESYTTENLTVLKYNGSVFSCEVTANSVSSNRSIITLILTGE